MNIISPFGRISRRGYLAVAVPMFVAIIAIDLVGRFFAPGMVESGTPWSRWFMIAGLAIDGLVWGLFCACVKRLHDFRWTGLFALPLLWPWAWGVIDFVFPMVMHWQGERDVSRLLNELSELGRGLRFYSWALLIVLAIVPGHKRADDLATKATADAF